MFWRYNALTSHIDTLLEKETVTLHELMDEDDILQECKGQNHKLIEFLVTPDVMEELVKLITCEPSEDVEDKVKYKYPNIACELLTSDVSQILDKLIEENVLIDKIYSFMLSNDQLNPLLASFFTKVLGLLLVRKADYLFDYLTSKEDFLGHLLSHLGTSAIMDLLMRLVTYDPTYETKAKILKWMDEENLVEKLVNLIHPDQLEEIHCNAATTLCDIVKFGREQMGSEIPQPDPLLDRLECDAVLSKLLSNMLEGPPKNESVVTNGLLVIQTILEYRRQISSFDDWRPLPDGCAEPLPQSEIDRMDKAITCVLTSVKPRIGEFASLLTEPPQQSQARMCTTVGVLDPPLGNTRLQVSRLFATLFAVDDSDLHICLIESDVVNKLLDLFFQYVWNNFLHTQMEISISNILSKKSLSEDESPRSLQEEEPDGGNLTPTTVSQEEDTPLVTHLFKDCQVITRMVDAWQCNKEAIESGSQRKGYMGHVTKICNDLVSAAEKGPYSTLIGSLLSDLDEDTRERWTQLVTVELTETNKRNTSDLVGGHPLNSSSGSDSDSDFKDIPFPQDDTMQQAFSDYQMQQLTSTFIDQFGLSDEEFGHPNERIESAFTHQISSLDWTTDTSEKQPKEYEEVCEMDGADTGGDSGGEEEDLWKDKEITFNTSESSKSLSTSNTAALAGSDSDSSDEELASSPAIIKSKGDPSMEIDNITSAELAMTAPIAMDTSPWETAPTKAGGEDEEWTAFEGAENNSGSDSGGWADFTNLDSAPASDGGPRVSSPEALLDSPSQLSKEANGGSPSQSAVDKYSQSKNDSLNESLEQTPLSDDEADDSGTAEKTPVEPEAASGESNKQTPVPAESGGSAEQSNEEPKSDDVKVTVSMEVDEPRLTEASNKALTSKAGAETTSTTIVNKEGLAQTSEIEIAIPTGEVTGGGDSPKSEKAELNGPQASSKNEDEASANGPV